MPFSLKNAGATYQRCMLQCFTDQVECNMEVYIDGIIVKTKISHDLIADLEEMFTNL